jgi:RNA-directed DNA polymerase
MNETRGRNCMCKLMEDILGKNNLNQAYLQVYRNKGSHGIDKMTVDELKSYLKINKEKLLHELLGEVYKPKPVLMVEIPKDDGSKRMLGIPIVVDRLIQQAISQVLTRIFDKTFSESSYGFRPNRSAHNAIKQAKTYINEGYKYVVDIDLSKYFDTVNHDKLMFLLTKEIKDSRVLRLIRKFLKGGIVKNGTLEPTTVGVPQWSPLSPILANIYLHEIDK